MYGRGGEGGAEIDPDPVTHARLQAKRCYGKTYRRARRTLQKYVDRARNDIAEGNPVIIRLLAVAVATLVPRCSPAARPTSRRRRRRCRRSSPRRVSSASTRAPSLDGAARPTSVSGRGCPAQDELGANCSWTRGKPAIGAAHGVHERRRAVGPDEEASTRPRAGCGCSGYPALETFTTRRRVLPLRRRRRAGPGDRGDDGRWRARLVHRPAGTTHRCPVATSRIEVAAFRAGPELGVNPLTGRPGKPAIPGSTRHRLREQTPITDRAGRPSLCSGRAEAVGEPDDPPTNREQPDDG